MVLLNIFIEKRNHLGFLCTEFCLHGILTWCRAVVEQIVATEQTLAISDILQGQAGIAHDVVEDHVLRGTSSTGLTMEMKPGVGGQRLHKGHEGIQLRVGWESTVRYSEAGIAQSAIRTSLLLSLGAGDLNGGAVFVHGLVVVGLAERVDVNGLPQGGVDLGCFLRNNLGVCLAHVSPVVGTVARYVDAVEESMTLTTTINDIDRPVGQFLDLGLDPVQLFGREIAAARYVQFAQALCGGLIVGVWEEFRLFIGGKLALAGAPVLRLLQLVLALQPPAVGSILRTFLCTHVITSLVVVQVLVNGLGFSLRRHWIVFNA